MGQATLHASAAEQDGDGAFDASAEALSRLEVATVFESLTLSGFLSATLRNARTVDTRFAAGLLVGGVIKATIRGKDLGGMTESFLVSLQARLHMIFIRRVSVQDAVLRDQALRALSQEDFMTELDGFVDLSSLNEIGMWFED